MKLEEERIDFLLTLREKEENRFVDLKSFLIVSSIVLYFFFSCKLEPTFV